MNIQELKTLFDENDVSFEDVEKIIAEDTFSAAAKYGIAYVESMKFEDFEDAPFCIEKVGASPVSVVVADSVKPIIELMKKSAKDQSDKKKKADNYEASFCLHGRMSDGKIVITDAFWDERGYQPNAYKYADPDSLNYGSFFANYSNVTTTSFLHFKKIFLISLGFKP